MAMVAARLPLSFVVATIKLVPSKTLEHPIHKVTFVDVAIRKIECALSRHEHETKYILGCDVMRIRTIEGCAIQPSYLPLPFVLKEFSTIDVTILPSVGSTSMTSIVDK